MIDLRALGALDLRRRDGPELHSVLAQPKRTALLCYLALARPHGFHRRDTLVTLFWPEHDTEHARSSLRQSIHFLRRSLGEEAIVSRGDEEIGLGDGVLCCDAVQFDAALDAGDLERALELYAGDLLPGFFVEEAPEFERWLEAERTRLRERAIRACWSLAGSCEQAADPATAAEWGRRALAISPADDNQIIRLMQCLARSGDRAGALAAFEAHARRLRAELEVEPTAAARALAEEIRRREPPAPPATEHLAPRRRTVPEKPGAASPEPVPVRTAGGADRTPAVSPDDAKARETAPAESLVADAPVTAPAAAPLPVETIVSGGEARPGKPVGIRPSGRSLWMLALAALAILIGSGGWLARVLWRPSPVPAAGPPQRLAVLYFEDPSAGAVDRGFAATLTETLIEQFSSAPGLKVISAAGVAPYRGQHVPPDSIGRALQVGTIVSGAVSRDSGRIRVHIELLNARTAEVLESRTIIERPGREIPVLVDDVAREAALFLRRRIGEAVQLSSRPPRVSDKAWNLFQLGRQARADGQELMEAGEQAAALTDFLKADSLFGLAEHAAPSWIRPTVERAWVEQKISFTYSLPWGGRDLALTRRAIARGVGDATRALLRSPGDATALEVRGVLQHAASIYSAAQESRAAELRKAAEADSRAAVAADPHRAIAWGTIAAARFAAFDWAGAQAAASRAFEEDAYASDPGTNVWTGFQSAFQMGQDQRAREWCDEFRRRNRHQWLTAVCALELQAWGSSPPDLAAALRTRSDFGGADAPQNDAELRPLVDLTLAAVLARAGLRDSAEAVIARAAQPPATFLLPWEAQARVLLHQEDAAIRLLARYIAASPSERTRIVHDRHFDSLRTNPAFQTRVAAAGGAGRP